MLLPILFTIMVMFVAVAYSIYTICSYKIAKLKHGQGQ